MDSALEHSSLQATSFRPGSYWLYLQSCSHDNLFQRFLETVIFSDRQRIAITSEATVMSNHLHVNTVDLPCKPFTMAQLPVIHPLPASKWCGETMPKALPWWMWLSIAAASRLLATPMAWKSPVKWRLMSSIARLERDHRQQLRPDTKDRSDFAG